MNTADNKDAVAGTSTHVGGDVKGKGIAIGPSANATYIEYQGDTAYDVRGLKNPYIGLEAFTYHNRDRYAGRDEDVHHALTLLTTPGNERVLLFVTGASGSGKSSFVQAGLLPALEMHYTAQDLNFKWALFRPSEKPLAGLARALSKLNLPTDGVFVPAAVHTLTPPGKPADERQISILIIDQFEECFSQSEANQRADFFALLAELPSFDKLRMHVIVTMRADYLSDLFKITALYAIAKHGKDLHVMDEKALKEAITRPLQALHQAKDKRFQDALLDRLANDAAEDDTYLPLLQVTLEELWTAAKMEDGGWRGGILTIDNYADLGSAISKRADEIYAKRRNPDGSATQRSIAERETMLNIFLDLVDVSLEDDARHDVRRTRQLDDITRGEQSTEALVQELATARLLATSEKVLGDGEDAVESVDIIHESLIQNWKLLSRTIREQRSRLQQRRRFTLRLDEWREHHQARERLLSGVYLAEAEELQRLDDVATRDTSAFEFIHRSVQERERVQRRNQRITTMVAVLMAILAISVGIAAWVAFDQRNAAKLEAANSRSRQLAAESLNTLDTDPELAIDLALDAIAATNTAELPILPEVVQVLHRADQASRVQRIMDAHNAGLMDIAYSSDGTRFASADSTGQVFVWYGPAFDTYITLSRKGTMVTAIAFDHAGAFLYLADDKGMVEVWKLASVPPMQVNSWGWDIDQKEEPILDIALARGKSVLAATGFGNVTRLIEPMTGDIIDEIPLDGPGCGVAVSPDGTLVISGDLSGNIYKVEIGASQTVTRLQSTGTGNTQTCAITIDPAGVQMATGGSDGTPRLWSLKSGELRLALTQHTNSISRASFSPDGALLASAGFDNRVHLYEAKSGRLLMTLVGHKKRLRTLAFSPDGGELATADEAGQIRFWDVAFGYHSKQIYRVHFGPNGEYFASAGADGFVNVWDTDSERLVKKFDIGGLVRDIHIHPRGDRIAAITNLGYVYLLDVNTGQQEELLPIVAEYGGSVAYNHGQGRRPIGYRRGRGSFYLEFSSAGDNSFIPAYSNRLQCDA